MNTKDKYQNDIFLAIFKYRDLNYENESYLDIPIENNFFDESNLTWDIDSNDKSLIYFVYYDFKYFYHLDEEYLDYIDDDGDEDDGVWGCFPKYFHNHLREKIKEDLPLQSLGSSENSGSIKVRDDINLITHELNYGEFALNFLLRVNFFDKEEELRTKIKLAFALNQISIYGKVDSHDFRDEFGINKLCFASKEEIKILIQDNLAIDKSKGKVNIVCTNPSKIIDANKLFSPQKMSAKNKVIYDRKLTWEIDRQLYDYMGNDANSNKGKILSLKRELIKKVSK